MNSTACMTLSSALLLLSAGCTSTRAKPQSVEVPVMFQKANGQPGILVKLNGPVAASGKGEGVLDLTFINLFQQEVFLEVEGFDGLSCDLRLEGENGEENVALLGSIVWVFPDNLNRLKRLHASTKTAEGQILTCGCAMAHVHGKVGDPDIDLMDWVGAEATVTIPVRGYFRKDGSRFTSSIDIPFTIIAKHSEHGQ